MGYDWPRGIILGKVCCWSWLAVGAVLGKPMTYQALQRDPTEVLIRSYYEQIATLRCSLTVPPSDGTQGRTVRLSWDVQRDWYNAVRTYVPVSEETDPNVLAWVANGEREWVAVPERHGPLVGSWYVYTGPRGQGVLPSQITRADICLPELRRALVPYTVRSDFLGQLGQLESTYGHRLRIDVTEQDEPESNRIRRAITVAVDGKPGSWTIRRVLSRDDGLRIHEVVEEMSDSELLTPITTFVGRYDHHVMSNGVWLPCSIKEQQLDLDTEQMRVLALTLDHVEINAHLTLSDFTYVPPRGSLVEDIERKVRYRVGMAGTSGSSLLADDGVVDVLDRLDGNDHSVSAQESPDPAAQRIGGGREGPALGAERLTDDDTPAEPRLLLPGIGIAVAAGVLALVLAWLWTRVRRAPGSTLDT